MTALTVGVLALAVNARAGLVLGSVWLNDPNPDHTDEAPGGSPDAQFYVTDINFNSNVTGYTVGAFVGNPTFFDMSSGFILAGEGAAGLDFTYWQFTGSAYLVAGGNSFVVAHDDGVILTFPALNSGNPVVDAPLSTPIDYTPFTVTAPSAGSYDFTLDYSECCGAPGILIWTVNGGDPIGTPEPGSFQLMLGALMIGIGGGLYRKRT